MIQGAWHKLFIEPAPSREGVGLEPAANATPAYSKSTYCSKCCSRIIASADFLEIAHSWPDLPPELRIAILTIVRSHVGSRTSKPTADTPQHSSFVHPASLPSVAGRQGTNNNPQKKEVNHEPVL